MRWRPVLVSMAVMLVCTATAVADTLPGVPSVNVPSVPTVTVPKVPVPVPTVVPAPPAVPVPVPVPALPAPSVPSVHVPTSPSGGGGGSSPSSGGGTSAVTRILSGGGSSSSGSTGAGGVASTVAAGTASGSPGSSPAAGGTRRTLASSRTPAERRTRIARERRHSWQLRHMVLRLAGCVDDLPSIEERVLILRAAPMRQHPRSRHAVARKLDTGTRRVTRIEHRAVRRLRTLRRTTGCENTESPFAAGTDASGGSAGEAVLAGFGGSGSGSGGASSLTGGTSGGTSGAGGGGTGSSSGGGNGSGGHGGSSGGVKGESRSHSGGGNDGIFPGVGIGPKPGSRDWLLLVGVLVGALLVFLGRAIVDHRRRKRREALYY